MVSLTGNANTHRSRWRLKHILIVALVTCAPISLGFPLAIWAARNALDAFSREHNREIIERVDAIVEDADRAMSSAVDLLDDDCEQIIGELRRRTAATTFVRSMQLLNRGNIYCWTITGAVADRPLARSFVDGRLGLFIGRVISPGEPMLGVRLAVGERSIVAYVDQLHVSRLLAMGEFSERSILAIGAKWMDENGEIHEGEFTPPPVGFVTTSSGKYPYSIKTGFAADAVWAYLWSRYWPLLIFMVCLGAAAGYGTHRLLIQARGLRAELRRGLQNGELLPFYQPLASGDATKWAGVEVLVRWQHPLEGLLSPHVFIPFMERTDLIVPMTTHLLERVADELRPVVDLLPKPFHIGINISAAHLTDPQFVDHCRRFLSRFPGSGASLFLELTEREEIVATEDILERLRQLRAIGVRLALDDFGVGYSSLKSLMEFEADILKIDRAFVTGVPANNRARQILDNIVDLAGQLKMGIVAEGIETLSEVDYLKTRKGIDFLQGYFFARPMQIHDLLVVLASPPPKAGAPFEHSEMRNLKARDNQPR